VTTEDSAKVTAKLGRAGTPLALALKVFTLL
jgi:hypothetical protein